MENDPLGERVSPRETCSKCGKDYDRWVGQVMGGYKERLSCPFCHHNMELQRIYETLTDGKNWWKWVKNLLILIGILTVLNWIGCLDVIVGSGGSDEYW